MSTLFSEDPADPSVHAKQWLRPLVIYHGNCLDGFTAAWCFWNAQDEFETAYNFHPGVYNDPPPDCTGRIVYLVDFSYKRAVVKEICKVAREVYLIDHHKTAIEDLMPLQDAGHDDFCPNFFWYVDINRSGAKLAWDFLHNTLYADTRSGALTYSRDDVQYREPPLLLDYVEDRDLWKFKLAHSREVNASLFSYKYSFEDWDKLMSGSTTELLNHASAGRAIERKHHKDIEELLNVCRTTAVIAGHLVPVANLPYTMASDACTIMAKEWKDGTMFAASYYDTATHRVYSLRSGPDGMDVSVIAKSYGTGGGGHKHAAGFRIPLSNVMKEPMNVS